MGKNKKFGAKFMNNNTKKTDFNEKSAVEADEKTIAKEQQEVEEVKNAESQAEHSGEKIENEISDIEKELSEAQAKIDETNDKYLRLAAEFDNYRRRVAKEKLDLISTASEDVIKGILPVLDDCYRALQVLKDSKADESAIEGTSLILNKLDSFLKTKGLSMIEAKGKDFDTDDMEAVTQFPVQDEKQKGKVIDVVQDGYMLNGKVIRFAKVVVGA